MPRPKPSAPQWQPGQSGNPKGRPIGSRNKLNEKFILGSARRFREARSGRHRRGQGDATGGLFEGDRIDPTERASLQERVCFRRHDQ